MSKNAKPKSETSNARPYPSREEEPARMDSSGETEERWGWLRPEEIEATFDDATWDGARWAP